MQLLKIASCHPRCQLLRTPSTQHHHEFLSSGSLYLRSFFGSVLSLQEGETKWPRISSTVNGGFAPPFISNTTFDHESVRRVEILSAVHVAHAQFCPIPSFFPLARYYDDTFEYRHVVLPPGGFALSFDVVFISKTALA